MDRNSYISFHVSKRCVAGIGKHPLAGPMRVLHCSATMRKGRAWASAAGRPTSATCMSALHRSHMSPPTCPCHAGCHRAYFRALLGSGCSQHGSPILLLDAFSRLPLIDDCYDCITDCYYRLLLQIVTAWQPKLRIRTGFTGGIHGPWVIGCGRRFSTDDPWVPAPMRVKPYRIYTHTSLLLLA